MARKDSKTISTAKGVCETQSSQPRFLCTLCGESDRLFTRAYDLERHLATHNPTHNGFACPFEGCEKVDVQAYNIQIHLKTHFNTKDNHCGLPFPDDIDSKCDFKCVDPSSMRRHIASLHEMREGGKATNPPSCPDWMFAKIQKRREDRANFFKERRLASGRAKSLKEGREVCVISEKESKRTKKTSRISKKGRACDATDTASSSNSTLTLKSPNCKREVPSPTTGFYHLSSLEHEDGNRDYFGQMSTTVSPCQYNLNYGMDQPIAQPQPSFHAPYSPLAPEFFNNDFLNFTQSSGQYSYGCDSQLQLGSQINANSLEFSFYTSLYQSLPTPNSENGHYSNLLFDPSYYLPSASPNSDTEASYYSGNPFDLSATQFAESAEFEIELYNFNFGGI